ncbi:MAG: hypothetical protein ACI8ZB_004237 [Desulforhopalus sp.]|jgi:hypothetical protein
MRDDMQNILNITNGHCAIKVMEEAGVAGTFLPWMDVLHEGPVPKGLTLEELSKVRGEFIVRRGWGPPEVIERDFIERDNVVKSFHKYEKVILWFEHDLYDQLQVLQILDWFQSNSKDEAKVSLICRDKYLGALSPDEMRGLMQYEEPVTGKHLLLASRAWAAFREDSPEKWNHLLTEELSVLPFLQGAIVRMLEEYPNCKNGLSRTAQQALQIIAEGEKKAGKVFGRSQGLEERIFLGDASFWVILQEFLDSSPALLTLTGGEVLTQPTVNDGELAITPVGVEVLSGKRNWLGVTKRDRWIGGVHIEPNHDWCWDGDSGSIVKK